MAQKNTNALRFDNPKPRRSPSTVGTQQRWNGTKFPIPHTMPEQFARLSRYPIAALSTGALFALAMQDYPDPRQLGVSNYKEVAE